MKNSLNKEWLEEMRRRIQEALSQGKQVAPATQCFDDDWLKVSPVAVEGDHRCIICHHCFFTFLPETANFDPSVSRCMLS